MKSLKSVMDENPYWSVGWDLPRCDTPSDFSRSMMSTCEREICATTGRTYWIFWTKLKEFFIGKLCNCFLLLREQAMFSTSNRCVQIPSTNLLNPWVEFF